MNKSIPASIVRSAIEQIAPQALDLFAKHFADLDFDLGPMTPDVRPVVEKIDAEVDAKITKIRQRDVVKRRLT